MELQGYGVVEARPTYAHVGYVSGIVRPYIRESKLNYAMPLLFVIAGVVLLAAAVSPSSSQAFGRRLSLALLAGLLGLAGLIGGLYRSVYPMGTLSPEMLETLQTLEHAIAEADAELAAMPSTEPLDDWLAEWPSRSVTDGWGNAFAVAAPGQRGDGRRYVISTRRPADGDEPSVPIRSTDLGPDGKFGTADDRGLPFHLAVSLGINPQRGDGQALERLAARMERAER